MNIQVLHFIRLLVLISISSPAQPYPIGHRTMNFTDPSRNNRAVPAEVYYPAQTAGNNTSVENGTFPVIVFGHGFLMPYSAYGYFKDAMVPDGYFVVFPTTEGGILPNHSDYGADLAFLIVQMKTEGNDPTSPFFLHVDSTSAVMGHSMGGGASFLACKNNTVPTVMVTFAAAETNPSAIAAAAYISIPNLVFAADKDCVTPPPTNQIPMYDSLAADCKVLITIKGGGHCYFADYNFQCSLGETGCQQNFTISRDQQHAVTLDFTKPYLDYYLKKNNSSWTFFNDSLATSPRINYEKSCVTTSLKDPVEYMQCRIFPNPVTDLIFINCLCIQEKQVQIVIRSVDGIALISERPVEIFPNQNYRINLSSLPAGFYVVELKGEKTHIHQSFVKIQ